MTTQPGGAFPSVEWTAMQVTLGRVDERLVALARDSEARERVADARHAENRAALLTYVPRAEIEASARVVESRLSSLEASRRSALKTAAILGAAVIAGVIAVGKMAGAHIPQLFP